MEDKIKETIDYLKKKKVDYADIRHQKTSIEDIKVKNGNVEALSRNDDQGFGIRVIADGAWGFAASSVCSSKEMKRVADQAIQIAKASALTKKENVRLAETEVHKDKYENGYVTDPFRVAIDKKIGLLLDACEIMMKNKKIKVAEGSMEFFKTDKIFVSTEGAFIEQSILESGAGIMATAVDGSEAQRRSYPNSHRGDYASRGYEFVEELKLLENAERIREEAVQLLSANPLPEMETTIIISGNQMALQVHESCGHPTELDRVLGTEISLAGGSFLTMDKLNQLKYGSEKVTITADATLPGGLGSFGYD
ncbi:MAG: TldD/PmbA family protein, partial [Candidatus Zixiibacteriota bacterium]